MSRPTTRCVWCYEGVKWDGDAWIDTDIGGKRCNLSPTLRHRGPRNNQERERVSASGGAGDQPVG